MSTLFKKYKGDVFMCVIMLWILWSAMFAWLISSTFLLEQTGTNNQPTIFFSRNKLAPTTSQQANEHVVL
jgi:hypothetical protein